MKRRIAIIIGILGIALGTTATSSGEDVVYVVNSYAHGTGPGYSTVMMLRNDTFAILETITISGDLAHTVAVTPDGTRLWVTCPPSNVIFVIDGETFEPFTSIDLGDIIIHRPMGAAISPDGMHAYVTLEETGEVNVYNASTAAFVDTIAVGGAPNYVVFNPSGTRAYLVDYQNAEVKVVDTSTRTLLATRTFGGHALQDAVVSPDGSRLYISNMDQNQVEIIRTSDNTVLAPIVTADIKPRAIGISPDGNYLFVGHYLAVDAIINMIRLSDNMVVSTADIPSNPRRMVVRDNGKRIIVTEHNDDEVYAYSVNGETLTFTASTDLNTIAGFAASPVGVAMGEYPSPAPDIKVNGMDGPLTLTYADTLTLTLHLVTNGRTEYSDWYLVGQAPYGLYFWSPSTFWTPTWVTMREGDLVDVPFFGSPPVPLAGIPTGTYQFVFAVDVRGDGVLNFPYLYWDLVEVTIVE